MKNISSIGLACSGCGLCAQKCPKQAIDMQCNEEGFSYPIVNMNLCNDCGACHKLCTAIDEINSTAIQSYIAITKNSDLYKNSASGGIFATIASEFLRQNENAYVCGAAYIEGKVRHILIQSQDEIPLLQNSKYVQSEAYECFHKIDNHIKDGAMVLFCGTPCQVHAISKYVKDTSRLYTIDLICHGVPSPTLLDRDLKIYGSSCVRDIKFRWKNGLFPGKSPFFLVITRKYGRKIVLSSVDPYFSAFMGNATFRESCYTCKYANLNRVGDITIGDCDSSSYYPNFHKYKSTSTVLINTDKGSKIWRNYENLFSYMPLDLELEASINHQLRQPSQRPQIRTTIYKDFFILNDKELKKRYAKPNDIIHRMMLMAYLVFPQKIVRLVFSWIRR